MTTKSGSSEGFELDVTEFFIKTENIEGATIRAGEKALEVIIDDLIRISSQIAPIDKGTLRKSWDKSIKVTLASIIGEVIYSVVNVSSKGRAFNYAYWTHEMQYKLGERSRLAMGTDGYTVGNKYLERPLYGESKKYLQWIAEEIRKEWSRADD